MNRKEENEKYRKEMDEIVSIFWSDYYKKLKSVDLITPTLMRLELLIPVGEEFLTKYNLQSSGLEFKLIVTNDESASAKIEPCFYTTPIKPQGFYLLPDDYEEVGVLDIVQEAVKQNTYDPNIMHLQSKKYRENEIRN
jgi:hypothetical protein